MKSESAHLDLNHVIAQTPFVETQQHVEEVAHHALKNIQGGTEFVKRYFSKDQTLEPPPKRRRLNNQRIYLGWE